MTLRRLLAPVTLALALVAGCASAPPAPPPSDPGGPVTGPPTVAGLAVYRATGDVRATVRRLEQALERGGAVTATVDHAANAASIGERLRPTTLVIGGNPRAGTPIQQSAPVAGLNLPAKFLVWQDQAGAVWLGHDTAAYVAARAGAPSGAPAVETLAEGLGMLARTAARTDAPAIPGDELGETSTEGYLRTVTSPRPVPEVVAALDRTFRENRLREVATVDHARGAASVGAPLAPSTVTLAGNPQAGTALMQDRQTIGIDLPTRYLAWSDGVSTRITYPDPTALGARHGLRGQEAALERVAQTQERIATAAAG